MTITTGQFASTFHALPGTSIGEKKKHLYDLLGKVQRTNSQIDFASLQPKTHLEEKFKLEALIYLRRTSELLDLLKSDNPMMIDRILKIKSWFLDEVLQNGNGEQLVTQLLPLVSFNTKVKLLNKLSQRIVDPDKADELFLAIKARYGLYLASRLLGSCSQNLILNCIENHKITPSSAQMMAIVTRYPDIIERVFRSLKANKVNTPKLFRSIFSHLLRNKVEVYVKLRKEFSLTDRLGRRATERVVRSNKDIVIDQAKVYMDLLNKKWAIRSMGGDFGRLYYRIFPTSLSKFENAYDELLSMVKEVPRNVGDVNLFLVTFQRAYGTEIWNHPELVKPELLELLPNDERQKVLSPKYKPLSMIEDEWNCYQSIDKSIPFLKKRISFTSDIETRAKLIRMLVETCRINRDDAALTGICKYLLNHHRNDHITVRLGFLRALRKSYKLTKLNLEQWTCVNEFIQLFVLNGEECSQSEEFVLEYLRFRLGQGLPILDELKHYLKVTSSYSAWNILTDRPSYEKQCLLGFGQIYPTWAKEDNVKNCHWKFIAAILCWNKRRPSDPISVFDYRVALESVMEHLRTHEVYSWMTATLVWDFMKQKVPADDKLEFLNAYYSNSNLELAFNLFYWILKYEPDHLDLNHTLSIATKCYYPKMSCFWRFCRNYSHLGLPEKLAELAKAKMAAGPKDDSEKDLLVREMILALSYLMPSDQFRSLISQYYPATARIDKKSKAGKKTYEARKSVCYCLKNLPPSLTLDTCRMFHKGDYFKLTLPSLYFACRNVGEAKVLGVVDDLMRKGVSSRKRAVRIVFGVLDRENIFKFLDASMGTERNASVRKVIFRSVLGFFGKNADDYSWELVKLNVNSIDSNDKEALNVLAEIGKIPKNYLVQYVTFVWDFYQKLDDVDGAMELRRAALLNALNSELVQSFTPDFCDGFIARHFFKAEGKLTAFQLPVQAFVSKYVVFCENRDEQGRRLRLVFGILRDFVVRAWSDMESNLDERVYVNRFVKRFCSEFLEDRCTNADVLKSLISLWTSALKPDDDFDDYLHLQFSLIHSERLGAREIGQRIGALCDSLAEVYGSVFLTKFHEKLQSMLDRVLPRNEEGSEEDRFTMIESVVRQNGGSVARLILALLLLKGSGPKSPSTKVKVEEMMKVFRKADHPTVKIYLHFYLSQVN